MKNALTINNLKIETEAVLEVGDFQRVYDPSVGEKEQWYINDHCIARGPDGLWHMFGITHAEPLNPMDEKSLAHATAIDLMQPQWEKHPHAMTADKENWDEFHLWAPYIIKHDGLYYMYVCVGDENSSTYKIHLATSSDLFHWERHAENPMVVDGYDARDACVVRIGDQWVMYYTATSEPGGGNHVVAYKTSDDLVHWDNKGVAFVDNETGTSGGSTESPFILRRGKWYYLCICNNDRRGGYDMTDVYRSEDPFHWDFDNLVASIPGHACEIVHDVDGRWYVSRCGWGRGGLYMAPLEWFDGADDDDCSI